MPTALIIGGSSDIGLALARKFAEAGYDIQLTARKVDMLSTTLSDINIRFKVNCKAYPFLAEDINNHAQFFENLNPRPNVAIYVIGYMGTDDVVLKSGVESLAIINSNYIGAVSVLNIIAAYFAKEKKGTIIGISSVAGERGRQSNLIYGSAKAAFSSYLSGLRNFLTKFDVQVITIKPGYVNTKMTNHLKLPRFLTASPELVAKKVFHAYKNKRNTIYVKMIWRLIMIFIRNIPESLFKKMKL